MNSVTPDMDDFSDEAASFALDACTAVYSLLEYLLESNSQYIADIATNARDTVYSFVQQKYDMNHPNSKIEYDDDSDPLMMKEKKRQRDLLDKLKTLDLDNVTDELIEYLRDNTPIIKLEIFEE